MTAVALCVKTPYVYIRRGSPVTWASSANAFFHHNNVVVFI